MDCDSALSAAADYTVALAAVDELTRLIQLIAAKIFGDALAGQLIAEMFDKGSIAFDARKLADAAAPIIAARETLRAELAALGFPDDRIGDDEEDDETTDTDDGDVEDADNDQNAGSVENESIDDRDALAAS